MDHEKTELSDLTWFSVIKSFLGFIEIFIEVCFNILMISENNKIQSVTR